MSERFVDLNDRLLVSCCNFDGGLYEIRIDHGQVSVKKIMDGNIRGIAKNGNHFILLKDCSEIVVLDADFEIQNKVSTPITDFHGVAVYQDHAYIVETCKLEIGIYQVQTMTQVDHISLKSFIHEIYHVNDIFFRNDRLLISVWLKPRKPSVHGMIVEYCPQNKIICGILSPCLSQPHSVLLHEHDLCCCESGRRRVMKGNHVMFCTSGYPRGLAVNGNYYYIGQSQSRNLSASCNFPCGVHVFNESNMSGEFIPLPSSEVYAVLRI